MLDLTCTTVQSILTLDRALEKSLPAGYPNCCPLQKEERVQCSEDFLQLLWQWSLAVLDNIVTMEEPGMSFNTPVMKLESEQWVQKGQTGPFKAQVHASRMKQFFLLLFILRDKANSSHFFDARGFFYTNDISKGEIVNSLYIKSALSRFLKGPSCCPRKGSCTWTTPQCTPLPL